MMKIRYKLGLWISICSLLAVCCSRPINIDVTNFEIDTVPLPMIGLRNGVVAGSQRGMDNLFGNRNGLCRTLILHFHSQAFHFR